MRRLIPLVAAATLTFGSLAVLPSSVTAQSIPSAAMLVHWGYGEGRYHAPPPPPPPWYFRRAPERFHDPYQHGAYGPPPWAYAPPPPRWGGGWDR